MVRSHIPGMKFSFEKREILHRHRTSEGKTKGANCPVTFLFSTRVALSRGNRQGGACVLH